MASEVTPSGKFRVPSVARPPSPMNPPDAFTPSTVDPVAYNDMTPFLQKLMDEHKVFIIVTIAWLFRTYKKEQTYKEHFLELQKV